MFLFYDLHSCTVPNLSHSFPVAVHNIITILCGVTLSGLLGTIKVEAADSP